MVGEHGIARATWRDHVVEDPIGLRRAETQHVGSEYLLQPIERSHTVQFYDGEAFLIEAVCKFVGAGLQTDERVLVIATRERLRAVDARLNSLGFDAGDATARGRLMTIDAQQMLSQFMAGDLPDEDLFNQQLARTLDAFDAAQPRESTVEVKTFGPTRVRVYGEMVDALARAGNVRGAIALEQLWSEVGRRYGFTVLCAYNLSSFQRAGDAVHFAGVCELHSHVLPTESFACCPDRVERLREVCRLQQSARALEHEVAHRLELEDAVRSALSDRSRIEDELVATVKREREARARADASQAFKEVFLGMLGHDLRNPLNTILTTARLMLMRRELEAETAKRIVRLVSSGERMQRMIEQILDATHTRLSAGIVVQLGDPCDLVPLVRQVTSEMRAANTNHSIELDAPAPCLARINTARMEQVLANILGNAIAHGDPARGIRVSALVRDGTVCVTVHNYGVPIDPENQAMLFEPFKRGGKPQGRSSGLGLGLYISQHVVRAHGGNIAVDSSEGGGTQFEIRLPRS
jgi:signal transduction histidine kinase